MHSGSILSILEKAIALAPFLYSKLVTARWATATARHVGFSMLRASEASKVLYLPTGDSSEVRAYRKVSYQAT